jgi:DNA-binding CsgD family transcriptional regulator
VANGGTYFGPAVAALLRNVVANPATSSAPDFLTDREREILQLVAESHSTKEIAAKLGISVKTVDNHRTNLMRKLESARRRESDALRAGGRADRAQENRLRGGR